MCLVPVQVLSGLILLEDVSAAINGASKAQSLVCGAVERWLNLWRWGLWEEVRHRKYALKGDMGALTPPFLSSLPTGHGLICGPAAMDKC